MVKIGGHTQFVGNSWRLCPYSNSYYNAYYINGYTGNSINGSLSIITATHPYTEGTLSTWVRGGVPGFLCLDDACPYYLDNGERYFEV